MYNPIEIPEEYLISKIYQIRNQKVMVDRDLALLFGVETKRLKEAVRRNIARFPTDFMFEMNQREFEHWRREFVDAADEKSGTRYAPFCFTEQGVTMLSCILNSDTAIQMNIRIIRAFTTMREWLITHKDIVIKLKELEEQVAGNSIEIKLIFDTLKKMMTTPAASVKRIGFNQGKEP
jgi:hypothetical protein